MQAHGRSTVRPLRIAESVESALEQYYRENPTAPRPVVAVMGCAVNGPGEAREADIALAGGRDKFALYVGGRQVKVVPQSEAVDVVMETVREWRGGEVKSE